EQAGSISMAEARRLALERLRYEASLGLEVVPRVALARAVVMPATSQTIPSNTGIGLAQERPFTERKATLAPAEPVSAPSRRDACSTEIPAVSNLIKAERWKVIEDRAKACVSCALH